MEVTYEHTPGEACKVFIYTLLHKPHSLIAFLVPLVLTGLFALIFHDLALLAAIVALALALYYIGILLIGLLVELALKFVFKKRPYMVTSRIGPAGFCCVSPNGAFAPSWRRLSQIRQNDEFIFFWSGMGLDYSVPKKAFATPDEAQRFFLMAVQLRQSALNGEGREGELPIEGRWPPAPKSPAGKDGP